VNATVAPVLVLFDLDATSDGVSGPAFITWVV
jgi:hypothetical protein